MNTDWIRNDEDALIYVGDAMCSWCYGIAEEVTTLKNNHPELAFISLMGGLRPYNTERAIDMADFLKGHWDEVNKRSGQPFTYGILQDPEFIYDTEPASRAVVTVREMAPEKEFDFFKAVQKAFYFEGKNPNHLATYLPIAEAFELDTEKYASLFQSERIKEETKRDFQLAQEMGIKGFPSLVLKKNGQFSLIANGYNTAEQIEKIIAQIK